MRRSRRPWLLGVLIAALPALVLLLLVDDRSTILPAELARGAPAQQPALSSPAGPEPPSGLLFSGDFETGNLSQWEGAQRAAPGRITVVTRPVAQGRYAARFEVQKGDVAAPGAGSGNRSELLARRQDANGVWPESAGTERWYGWTTLFPRRYPIVGGWQTFMQWKNRGAGAGPVAMGVRKKRIQLQVKRRGGPATRLWKGPLERGKWQRFVLHVKWSPNPREGFVELWRNGKVVLRRTHRATMYLEPDGSPTPNYLKQGLYRSSGILPPQVVYHDGMRVGQSYADVAPTAPGRRR